MSQFRGIGGATDSAVVRIDEFTLHICMHSHQHAPCSSVLILYSRITKFWQNSRPKVVYMETVNERCTGMVIMAVLTARSPGEDEVPWEHRERIPINSLSRRLIHREYLHLRCRSPPARTACQPCVCVNAVIY